MHEDCMVTHAGPIHSPGVDIVCICTDDDISQCTVDGKGHVRMAIQKIHVVFVVIDGRIQPGESPELYFHDGMKAVK